MGRIIRLLCLILLVVLLLSCLAASASDIIVRVGLTTIGKPKSLEIRCSKPFAVTGSDDTDALGVQDMSVKLRPEADRIEAWVETANHNWFLGPVRLTSSDADAVFEIVYPKVRNTKYRGTLEIRMKNGCLDVVNELPLEDYVRGVIPAEVGKGMLPEAQKAQVVAIRTYALTSMTRHKADGYNVCDTTNCQGFAGATRDAAWVDKVLEATRGQVVTYQGKLIHAVFSTDCGGMTRNNEDAGFGDTPWPYLRAVVDAPAGGERPTSNIQLPTSNVECPEGDEGLVLGSRASAAPFPKPETRNPKPQIGDPKSGIRNTQYAIGDPASDYCAASPSHTWSKTYTLDDLDRIFAPGYSSKIGKLQSVEFVDYDVSGRAKGAVIKGDKGEARLTSIQFRSLMGVNVFKSMRMSLTVKADGKYVVNGRGFGHGVGLCAYGTNGLAKAGMKYADILKFYYKGVEIKQISDVGLRTAD